MDYGGYNVSSNVSSAHSQKKNSISIVRENKELAAENVATESGFVIMPSRLE